MLHRRIIVIDDHPLMRDALVARIRHVIPQAVISYSGDSIEGALQTIKSEAVDLVVLDLDLGDGHSPVANTNVLVDAGVPVMIVSALADPTTVRSALRAGALGFISKQSDADEFENVLRQTLIGQPSMSQDVAAMLSSDESVSVPLSEREKTALVLYASGLKLDAVARRMGVRPATVQEYIRRVREKYLRAGISAPTKTDLYRQARAQGLVN